MFVVAPDTIMSLTGQPQKKGVSADTQKNQIKSAKDALSVNLFLTPAVTNTLSTAEGCSCRDQNANILASMGSEGFDSKGGFDLEGGI